MPAPPGKRGASVRLEEVGKRYLLGEAIVVALDRVSLTVPAGSVVGITGPSGSGKSTLLHVVGAMDKPDEGSITVGETEVTTLDRRREVEYRRKIGFVFQRFHLLPALTAVDNVAAPLLPYKTRFDKFEKARQLLAAVGLAGRESAVPSRLSGGQQQRVAIARALVNEPHLLLADEPSGNVDSPTAAEIMQLLLDLREERGMTILIATHDPIMAARCDRIIRLVDGRVLDDVDVPLGEDAEAVLERISRIEP